MFTPLESVACVPRVGMSPWLNLQFAPLVQLPLWKSPHMPSPLFPPLFRWPIKFSQAAYRSGSFSLSGIGICSFDASPPVPSIVTPTFWFEVGAVQVVSPVCVLW